MVTREQIFESAHQLAIKALQNFIKNIGLNIENFEHLYETPITIGPILRPEHAAEYNYYNNNIKINNEYLTDLAKKINDKKANENTVILNVAKDLVRELIHANRTITVINPQNKTTEKNLISAFYVMGPNEDEEYASERANSQVSLDEIITDALSEVIIKSISYKVFNFEEINEFIQTKSDYQIIKEGLNILDAIGPDKLETLRWFMTAAYQKNYEDLFEKTFQDEYDDLLYYVNDIYTSDYCEEKIDQNSINQIEEIIERKKIERKRK